MQGTGGVMQDKEKERHITLTKRFNKENILYIQGSGRLLDILFEVSF